MGIYFHIRGGTAVSTGSKIAVTDNDICYQTAIIGSNFEYHIYLLEGNYKLTLKFAEICPEEIFGNGSWVFNVFTNGIEGDFGKNKLKLLSDFDIYEETKGINSAIYKEFIVHVKRL